MALAACAVFGSVPSTEGATQVVIDRILSRAYDEILTLSDVWQAIDLRLVPVDTQTEVQTETPIETTVQVLLENRRLILREVDRLPVSEPTVAALARQRSDWETRLGPGSLLADRLERAGMTEQELDSWIRDDARINDYLSQRFSATEEAGRPAAMAFWVSLLRQRAGLR